MLKRMLSRWLDGFERTWRYDASYMRLVLRVSPASLLKFAIGTRAPDVRAAPGAALIAAGLVGTLAEDCGPCTQIAVDMATAHGVPPAILRAIVAGDEVAMGETAALAWRAAAWAHLGHRPRKATSLCSINTSAGTSQMSRGCWFERSGMSVTAAQAVQKKCACSFRFGQ